MGRTGPVTKDTSTVALGLAQIRVGNSATNISQVGSVLTADQSIGALANTKYTGEVSYWKLESGFPLLEDMTVPLRETASLECAFKELSPKNLAIARGLDPSEGAGTMSVSGAHVVVSVNGDLVVDQTKITVASQDYIEAGTYTVEFTSDTAYDVRHDSLGTMKNDAAVGISTTEGFSFDGINDALTLAASFVTGTHAAGDIVRFSVVNLSSNFADNHTGSIGLGSIAAPKFVRMEAVYTYPNGVNHMYIIFPRANAVATTEIDLQAEDAAAVPLTFEAKRADAEVSGGNAAWDAQPLGIISFD